MNDKDHATMVEQMTEALSNGQKIEAIKIYCDATGSRLREAKEFVDQLIPELIEKDPDQFGHLTAKRMGCGTTVLLALLFFIPLAFTL